jgi:DNA-binding MarR family transcriptional regulator
MIIDNSISVPARSIAQASDMATAVLSDIRRVIRASDIQSRRLQKLTGMTTAQALILRAIADLGEVTTRLVSETVMLSPATVTTIMDRMEAHGLIERYRSTVDRRIVHAKLTSKGKNLLSEMPGLLDEKFMMRFDRLPAKRRKEISSALSEVAQMMNADVTDAAAADNGPGTARVKRA